MQRHHSSRQTSPGRRRDAQSAKVPLSMPRTCACLALLAIIAVVLAGCGSTSPSPPASAPPASQTPPTSTEVSSSETTTSTTNSSANPTAAPDDSGPPAFVTEGSTENGDKLHIEGRFGAILPASESDVDQTVLSECPQYDGRELVTRLDLTTTLESSLSGTVNLVGFVPPLGEVSHLIDYVLGFSEGPTCELVTEESGISINLGRLQPHESHNFTMWVVLLDAITPNDPHPSVQTLAHQNWIMGAPEATVDGASVRLSGDDAGIPLVK